jgi:CheY-like chemotaxis protein
MMPQLVAPKKNQALILVAERDPHVRALEKYFLERAGFSVEFASDGQETLDRARILMPHIIITEILVRGMDGLSVCRKLKQDPATRSIIVMIFSILAADKHAAEAGADAFLRKPLNDTLLVESVEKLIQQHLRKTSHGTN